MGKPFDEGELMLRVQALLRRRRAVDEEARESHTVACNRAQEAGLRGERLRGALEEHVLRLPGVSLEIDVRRREVRVRGELVQLTPKEFAIVELLACHPGDVFTRDEIVAAVWGDQYCGTSISVPTYVRRIREKIERDPSEPDLLQTVFGFGYRIGR